MQLVHKTAASSALTAGHNPTHMDPTQHKHIIRTETAVSRRSREGLGYKTARQPSCHDGSADSGSSSKHNSPLDSAFYNSYCGSIVNRPTPQTQRECHTFPTAQLPEDLTHQVVAGRAVTSTAPLYSTICRLAS